MSIFTVIEQTKMSMELTDREFWKNYWSAKPELFSQPIERKSLFKDLFDQIIQKNNIKNAVEIGGFPGTFSALLQLEYGIPSDLVDYYIDDELISQFKKTNGLKESDIQSFEIDVFSDFKAEKQYDLVFSIGLIEHFEDTKKIIEGHTPFLNNSGTLFLIIPNFRGINGWIQRTFDMDNYSKHYIECMDPNYLKKLLNSFDTIETGYFGGFTIWLENYKDQNILTKILFKSIWLTGKLLYKVFGIKNRLFSPYIYAIGKLK